MSLDKGRFLCCYCSDKGWVGWFQFWRQQARDVIGSVRYYHERIPITRAFEQPCIGPKMPKVGYEKLQIRNAGSCRGCVFSWDICLIWHEVFSRPCFTY